jgi:transcriptional regulator with GAF, ATPase, and Fis domain
LARDAKAAEWTWHDDQTMLARARVAARDRGCEEAAVVAYGYVGRLAEPARIDLALRFTAQGERTRWVTVEVRPPPPSGSGSGRGKAKRDLGFLGDSAAARRVRSLAETAARCDYPVLILGETGVGKELVAKCIHAASRWGAQSIVVAECTATAESVLESELFGHERGAFTGAHARHSGYFERANGSSLFLDEVDSMSARMQAALLRVLETGDYRPVGAASPKRSTFRLISAALPRLMTMLDTGQFRQDLFYRISALRIEVPPLREREGDAVEIAGAHARTLGLRLTAGAQRAISEYPWPGNVRQLRHCLHAASLHAGDGRIGEAAMVEAIGGYGGVPSAVARRGTVEAAWVRALRALERAERFDAWDFAQAAKVSRRSAQRHLARLLRDRRIVRAGAGRATRYRVNPDSLP